MWQLSILVTFSLSFQLSSLVEGVKPSATVSCPPNGFGISIVIKGVDDIDRWTESEWRLNNVDNSACMPEFNQETRMVSYLLNGSTCANETATTDDFTFTFVIDATATGNKPVHAYDHHYTISCSYNRNGTARSSFTPLHDVSDKASDEDLLSFYMKLYENTNYSISLSPGISLGSTIYVEVGINPYKFQESLELVLDNCYTSTDRIGKAKKYFLVLPKCLLDGYLGRVTYDCLGQRGATDKRFSFEAFRYPGQDNRDQVWLHCDVYACVANENSTRCKQQCANCKGGDRVRREIDDHITYQMTAGPYRFVEHDNRQKANADTDGLKGNKSAFSATVITILTVSGAVVIAIVCVTVLIVVGKRRKNFPFNKNLESEIAMENPGCEAPSINNKI